jgi:hypothetical protein
MGNISTNSNSSKQTCFLLKCLLDTYLNEYECEHTFFPSLNELYCWDCFYKVKLPIGWRLRVLDVSSHHCEQSTEGFIESYGVLTVKLPNQLEEFYYKDNRNSIISSESQSLLQSFSGFKNFKQLKIVDLSNSAYNGQIGTAFEGTLESVEILNLAFNYINMNMTCRVFPRLKALNISHGNLTFLATDIISNCSSLNIVDLSFNNDLGIESLDNISFDGTDNIRRLILSNNGFTRLNKKFLDKVDAFPNMSLDLSSNIFLCDCESQSQEFIKWLLENPDKNRFIGSNLFYSIYFYSAYFS